MSKRKVIKFNNFYQSDQLATGLFFLSDHWLGLCLQNNAHCLVKHVLQALLGQSTALHVLALELFLDYFLRSFLHYWCLFGVTLLHGILVSQIDFVANEYFRYVSDVVL